MEKLTKLEFIVWAAPDHGMARIYEVQPSGEYALTYEARGTASPVCPICGYNDLTHTDWFCRNRRGRYHEAKTVEDLLVYLQHHQHDNVDIITVEREEVE